MKVEIEPRLHPNRGGEVKIGNVYSNQKFRYYRLVVGIIDSKHARRSRWANVVCIHVDATGEIVGCSCQPTVYMREHQDLVGHVTKMPSMKIVWNRESERERKAREIKS